VAAEFLNRVTACGRCQEVAQLAKEYVEIEQR
jgi:hypothetical protein